MTESGWTSSGIGESAEYFDSEGNEITDWTAFEGYCEPDNCGDVEDAQPDGGECNDAAFYQLSAGLAVTAAALATILSF